MKFDFDRMILTAAIVCAAAGWASIEGLLWLINHVSISWSIK